MKIENVTFHAILILKHRYSHIYFARHVQGRTHMALATIDCDLPYQSENALKKEALRMKHLLHAGSSKLHMYVT